MKFNSGKRSRKRPLARKGPPFILKYKSKKEDADKILRFNVP